MPPALGPGQTRKSTRASLFPKEKLRGNVGEWRLTNREAQAIELGRLAGSKGSCNQKSFLSPPSSSPEGGPCRMRLARMAWVTFSAPLAWVVSGLIPAPP
jgi:hypothetical protein